MPQELAAFGTDAPLSLIELLINLTIGVVLAICVRWHFQRFGSTLSNREEFSQVFPFVLLTTVLIITVVKSSLALSLGLVGALSIVRFRTPIKEPEELAYLFISIAIGLGLGANQTIPTIVAAGFILAVMAALKWVRKSSNNKRLFLSVDWQGIEDDGKNQMDARNDVISKHVSNSDLRRFDLRNGILAATYMLDASDPDVLNQLVDDMREQFPQIGVTFLDQNQMPGI
jgi:hypothetical protein